jgi:epoxyqueuosine reductase
MNRNPSENRARLRDLALREGAVLFGAVDVRPFRPHLAPLAAEAGDLDYAVSMGVALSPAVLEGCQTGPTLLYKWHYRQANNLLDRIAFLLSQRLVEEGARALPVPASQMVDWTGQTAHLSHRAVAERAGLGWRGRNNLIVNPAHGAGIRLVTVLTDLPLETGIPAAFGCGSCRACLSACPAGAIGETAADYRLERCHETLTAFSRERSIGVHICGVCVRACVRARAAGTAGSSGS